MDKNSCSCRDVELLISKSVDGECSASDREKLHAHLSLCSECRSVQSDFERIQSLLERTVSADLVVPPPLPDVSHLADDARTKGSRSAVFWRQGGRLVLTAAACFVLFFSGHYVGARQRETSSPLSASAQPVHAVPVASAYVVSAPSMWVSVGGGAKNVSAHEAETEKPFVERINKYRKSIGEQLRNEDVDWAEIRRLVEAMGELRTDLELLTLHMAYLEIRTGSPASQVAQHWESIGEAPFGRSAKR